MTEATAELMRRGEAADDSGDLAEAFRCFKAAADAGDKHAYHHVGFAYLDGDGVAKNEAEAFRHFQAGARAGVAVSQYMLSIAYRDGLGVRKSRYRALAWLRKAAKGDLEQAQDAYTVLGTLYPEHKFPWFSAAAFALASGVFGLAWNHLGNSQKTPALCILAAFGLWLLFKFTARAGEHAQDALTKKFTRALEQHARTVWIGGAKWTIVNGEFYRAGYSSGAGVLYDGKGSQAERTKRELVAQHRREQLAAGSTALSVVTGILWAQTLSDDYAFLAAIGLFGLFAAIAWEYVYRRGIQVIYGAMTLDPPPARPQRDEVEAQRVHGDADFNSEAEAVAAASGTRRLPIHDQEF